MISEWLASRLLNLTVTLLFILLILKVDIQPERFRFLQMLFDQLSVSTISQCYFRSRLSDGVGGVLPFGELEQTQL